GIVADAQHRVSSKNGKPFGTFNVEDYSGSLQLTLFSEDYLKFKHFLVNDTFLFVRAKVQQRFRDSDLLEVKITSMQLLSEIGNTMTKSVTLNVNSNA